MGSAPVEGPSVHFRTLGCKVNRVESDRFAATALGLGATVVDPDRAAVIVINTCTVTGEADAKARKAVRQALKAAMSPVVVVTGCLAALDAEGLRRLDERVVVEADKERVAHRVANLLGLDADEAPAGAGVVAVGQEFRTRGSIKVEDGCDNRCTYCIVPDARGGPRATPFQMIVEEADALVQAGVAEIVLTGINIGRYRDGQRDLAAVISGVAATGVSRIRLSSLEPPDLTQELLEVIATTPAVCEHLHIPLQSGSDRILLAMGRHYDSERYLGLVAAARAAVPGLALTTDVIAGFPGETEADHAQSVALVCEAGFSKIHVFRYSERPGTPAASLPQLDPQTRAARAGQLREVGEKLRADYIASRRSSVAELLVESVSQGVADGTTRDYLRVTLDAPAGVAVGDVVDVALESVRCR